jgi:hypothetical protein
LRTALRAEWRTELKKQLIPEADGWPVDTLAR